MGRWAAATTITGWNSNSAPYFRGLWPRHVLEVGGRAGVLEALGNTEDVPFFERYYLGGLYSLRGFEYR